MPKLFIELKIPLYNYLRLAVLLGVIFILSTQCLGQEKQSVQIKVFDVSLKPLGGFAISINAGVRIPISDKGTAIITLDSKDLPIRSIAVEDEKLEAASWNLSKGILEVIVREKNYYVVSFILQFPDGKAVPSASITFYGSKELTVKSNPNGEFVLPISLQDKVTSISQFKVERYRVQNIKRSGSNHILMVDFPAGSEVAKALIVNPQNQDFDNRVLDSIKSLTMFYSVFKNISIGSLNEETRKKVDAKFNALVLNLQDSLTRKKIFMGNISDSSFVIEDIRNLLNYATIENESLLSNRKDFQRKIDIISDKLETGITNLNGIERKNLLNDLDLLEKLLIENEGKFYQNQNDYQEIINTLRQKYFDIENLETKLSEAEKEREEEQRIFRLRLLLVGGLVFLFGVLIVILLSFSGRLRKQKKELTAANEEINSINENLEQIVINRTELLANSNIELDTFLYRASHDLRSPIRSIMGLCNIYDQISPTQYINLVQDTTLHMDTMLKRLGAISEINIQSKDTCLFSIHEILHSVKSVFNSKIKECSIEFHIDCPNKVDIQTSKPLLENILVGLIENAIFYSSLKSSDHRRVEVTVKKLETEIKLIVYDNGIGIPDDVQPKIFNMFYKGNELSKGNGLGLYMVQKSVMGLLGSYTVESKEGSYSKFTVSFPF